MTPRNRRVTFAAVSLLIAAGVGYMIYSQHEGIEADRAEATRLQGEITKARELLKKTPELIKEVIIQRETDHVIREILSDDEDVNNLVRNLHEFAASSGIAITSMKKQNNSRGRRAKEDFDRVGYTLSFDATAWEMLDFMDRVESHSRFISVTAFKLSGARRSTFQDGVEPRHRIQMDVETYVYRPNAGAGEVKIDGYDHKRELLVSEIGLRSSDLRVPVYSYSGPRGRRDPWIDPRMPVNDDSEALDIPTQLAMVEDLVQQVKVAREYKDTYSGAATIIEEMKAMSLFEETLAGLEEEIRRIESDNLLSFFSAQSQFKVDVQDAVLELRAWADGNEQRDLGPDITELEQTRNVIQRHVQRQEYELAREVFAAIEPRLRNVPTSDLKRQQIVATMERTDNTIQTVLEFESIPLDIGGIAIEEGRRPVALINGLSVAEGELLSNDLVVRNIQSDQIEFAYRGLILARPIESTHSIPR